MKEAAANEVDSTSEALLMGCSGSQKGGCC